MAVWHGSKVGILEEEGLDNTCGPYPGKLSMLAFEFKLTSPSATPSLY